MITFKERFKYTCRETQWVPFIQVQNFTLNVIQLYKKNEFCTEFCKTVFLKNSSIKGHCNI